MSFHKTSKAWSETSERASSTSKSLFHLHPLFLLVGIYYACTGELFLFLLSALVAIQHECAHAFGAASLGYKLNKIVLMPYGAVIDGDLTDIALKDEIFVALCGPICNLITAGFFVALWWLTPPMYAFTDVACHSSLSIGLVNLLPAYPLDGGRIFKCILQKSFLKRDPNTNKARQKADNICRILTLFFALSFLLVFLLFAWQKRYNLSLLLFGVFLAVGAFKNKERNASYEKMPFFLQNRMQKGVEIRHVAVLDTCSVKDALRFLSKGSFLVLEVYDREEKHLFNLSQNEFSALFLASHSPYQTLGELYNGNKKVDRGIPCMR